MVSYVFLKLMCGCVCHFFWTRGDFAWQLSLKCIPKVELLHGDLRKSISIKLINVVKIKDIEILLCSVSVMCW